MICRKCRAEIRVGSKFCPRCGLGVTGALPPRGRLARTAYILSLIGLIATPVVLAGGVLVAIRTVPNANLGVLLLGPLLIGTTLLAVCVALLVGLVGGALGIAAFVHTKKMPAERAVRRTARMAMILGLAPTLVAIAAAVFLSVRTANMIADKRVMASNESQALAHLGDFIRAQTEYARSNGGGFGPVECLADPPRCLPDGRSVRGQRVTPPEGVGYRFTFYPGPQVTDASVAGAAPGSPFRFTYVAVPMKWNETGTRAFCAEGNGKLLAFKHESDILRNGRCASVGNPLGIAERRPPATPSPPRSIEENEVAALADLRQILLAERAYAKVNGGRFDKLDCLAWPGSCLTSYDGPGFLSDALLPRAKTLEERFEHPADTPWADNRWGGYRHGLRCREKAPMGRSRGGCFGISSMPGFLYVAVPVSAETGRLRFCATDAGAICAFSPADARAGDANDCPPSCVLLGQVDMR